MDGPRGSLVIGLLFLIAGQLAFIASALTGGGGGSLLGMVLSAAFVVAVIRVVIELFREGAEQDRIAKSKKRSTSGAAGQASRTLTPRTMPDHDAGVPAPDPRKRRPTRF